MQYCDLGRTVNIIKISLARENQIHEIYLNKGYIDTTDKPNNCLYFFNIIHNCLFTFFNMNIFCSISLNADIIFTEVLILLDRKPFLTVRLIPCNNIT